MKVLNFQIDMKTAIFSAAALAVCSASSQAAPYYWQVATDSNDWNAFANFNSAPDGTGTAATAYSGADEYHVEAGKLLRTPNGSNAFSGAANAPLYLDGGTLRVRAATPSIGSLTTANGSLIYVQDGGGQNLSVTDFVNSSGATILEVDSGGNTPFAIAFTLGTLTGAGGFALNTSSSDSLSKTIKLSITTASAWTGNITWNDSDSLSLEFGNGLISGGGLVAPSTARITLNQDVTFASVTIAGDVLTPGTYTFAQLNSTYDTIFNEGGSGSITIAAVPEPATLVLSGLGLVVLLRRRIACKA